MHVSEPTWANVLRDLQFTVSGSRFVELQLGVLTVCVLPRAPLPSSTAESPLPPRTPAQSLADPLPPPESVAPVTLEVTPRAGAESTQQNN